MRTRVLVGLGLGILAIVVGCSGSDASPTTSTPDAAAPIADAPTMDGGTDAVAEAEAPKPRGFRMGFTPFPFAATVEGRDAAYDYLAKDADLYAFHQMAGVPWKAAAAGKKLADWGTSIRGTFEFQRTAKDAHKDHAVYLALSPLDDARKRLADEWDENEHMALTAPWSTYAFDEPAVKAAYLAFCEEAIATYAPSYLAIGIEVNLLKKNTPAAWPAYVALHRETYQALKAKHKDLPVFATFTVVDFHPSYANSDPAGQAAQAAQVAALADIMPYSDLFALSFYPYMSKHLTGPIPSATFDTLATMAAGKPIAIAESGYPAESFTLPSINATFDGTPEKQDAWLALLLGEAEARKFAFVVNFVPRDYDALWETLPEPTKELALVWRDTGFLAGDGTPRIGAKRWRTTLARPR